MLDLKKTEEAVWGFWLKENIEKAVAEAAKGKKKFWLLDGPPFANGVPHVGHIKNTVFKDVVARMKMMQGFDVVLKHGFDTHGLPIENLVEKKL